MKQYTNILKKLSGKGLKATHQRIVVLQVLQEHMCHPTADEVFKLVRKDFPTISLATVYNTLESFAKCGILNTVNSEGNVKRYDINTDEHIHLIDETSGELIDYCDSGLSGLIKDYLEKKKIPDFDIKEIRLNIIGNKKLNER